MYEKSLNEAELILSAQKDPIMQVHKVWEEIVKRSKQKGYEVASLADFSAMLDGDRRFQIIPGQTKLTDEQEILGEDDYDNSDMEQLGFCSEDRVKLRSVKIPSGTINEDEEEVGSIKRRAFANQVLNKNKTNAISKKSSKKAIKKVKPTKAFVNKKNKKSKIKLKTKKSFKGSK